MTRKSFNLVSCAGFSPWRRTNRINIYLRLPDDHGERGSASIWLMALSGVVVLSGVAAVLSGAVVLGRHRLTAAADLSALAAAATVAQGYPTADACAVASDIAVANGAHLRRCDIVSMTADVEVTTTFDLAAFGKHRGVASARAAPSTEDAQTDDSRIHHTPVEDDWLRLGP